MPGLNQIDFAQFCKMQNCPYETSSREGIRSGLAAQRFVFENGALIQDGIFYSPPDQTNGGFYALLALQREYTVLALAREEADWRRFKSECIERSAFAAKYPRNCPPPPLDAEKQLEDGAFRIQCLRDRLAGLDVALAQEPNRKAREERQRKMEELQAEAQAVTQGRAAAIRSMNI
jgi:hypothetical protein